MPVTLVRDNFGAIRKAVAELTRSRVYVGIPGDAPAREAEPGQKAPPTNAVIGYAMEYGLPEKNVPARPFLARGVANVRLEIEQTLKAGALAALDAKPDAARRALERAGMQGVKGVKDQIDSNVPPPLAVGTIEARARRGVAKDVKRRGRKGAKQYLKLLAEGTPREVLEDLGENALVKTLVDTGQLRNSVTYVVRDR